MYTVGIVNVPNMYDSQRCMYINMFEEKGVRVIDIPYNTTKHEQYKINGLIIPGSKYGSIHDKTVLKCITRFIILSLDHYFPIWGTCFGFQLLIMAIGKLEKLKKYPAVGLYPIKIYHKMPYLHTLYFNNHVHGISLRDFRKNENLNSFYNITATSIDDNNKEYVAAIEAKNYPIYGTQWHPDHSQLVKMRVLF